METKSTTGWFQWLLRQQYNNYLATPRKRGLFHVLKYNQKHQKEYFVSTAEIIILVIGIVLVIAGYTYNKICDSKKKKSKIPADFIECVGICKKHIEKNGKFHEEFEIVHDGKTLQHSFPPQSSKDKLHEINSIEKFYINGANEKDIKTAADFAYRETPADKKKLRICYAVMGAGLIIILIILMRILF